MEEGKEHSRRAIEMEPRNHQAHYTAGRIYYRQAWIQEDLAAVKGNRHLVEDTIMASWRKSSSHFEEAVSIKEIFPEASSYLALTYLKEKHVEQAVRESIKAVNEAEHDVTVLYRAGSVHYQARQFEAAERYLKQSIMLKKTSSNLGTLAFVIRSMKRDQEAYDTLKEALQYSRDNTTRAITSSNMASMALGLGKYDEVVEHAEAAMQWDPNHIHSYCNLARAHLRRGDSPQIAINICMQGMQVHRIHICFPRILAEAYYRLGKYDEALEWITESVEREPQEAQWWLLRAKILTAMERLDDAKRDVREALDREPENEEARAKLEEIERAAAERSSVDS